MLLALSLAVLAAPTPQSDAPERPPNVVLFLADDLGVHELGCYGQERILTPTVDRLAAEGMRFDAFYAGAAVCAPARCVLLTGLHLGHAQVRANSPWASALNPEGEGQEPLAAGTLTLARWLSERDYATGCVGKWGLGGPGTSGAPNEQGFDRFLGYLCQKQAHDYYPAHLWSDDEKLPLDNPGFTPRARWRELPDGWREPETYAAWSGADYAPDVMLEAALEFVRDNAQQPFFLYYATPVPHAALQVPEDSLAPYLEHGWDEEPYVGDKGYLPHRAPRAAYAAMVTRMDRDLGRVLALIEELGLDDDTLVLFTSDNGPTYNGGSDSQFFRSAGELRGLKGSLEEGGIRAPLVARWPGRIAPGTSTSTPAAFHDLFPTLCELVGSAAPDGLDGASLAPMLLGQDFSAPERALYWETGSAQALRLGPWKLVRKHTNNGLRELLYDLDADPGEAHDLASEEPAQLELMRARMHAEHTPNANERFRWRWEADE